MSLKRCSRCTAEFECCTESRGCWCEAVQLSGETLNLLKEEYENCLCPNCLERFSDKKDSTADDR